MAYQGKFANKRRKRKNGRGIWIIAAVLVCVIGGLCFLLRPTNNALEGADQFSQMYASAVNIEDTQWPDSGTQGNATVTALVPDLALAYQKAMEDPENNGSNTIVLMNEYLKECCTEIQLDVPAEKGEGDWELDMEQFNRSVAEYSAENIDAFLNLALSDIDPIVIEIEAGEEQ